MIYNEAKDIYKYIFWQIINSISLEFIAKNWIYSYQNDKRNLLCLMLVIINPKSAKRAIKVWTYFFDNVPYLSSGELFGKALDIMFINVISFTSIINENIFGKIDTKIDLKLLRIRKHTILF